MGRLEELRINAYLSEVARGYRNNELIAHHLFPTIESELEKIDIFEFNKEAFKVHDTERAIRANSNVISPEGFKKHTATLTEHDLAYPIDYREENEAKKVKLEIHATNVVTQGLHLKHEKQCADLVQNANSYSTENKIILSGTSQFSDKTHSDPVGVIDDAKNAVCNKIGQDPNTMVLGQEVWEKLKRHPQLTGLLSDNQNKILTIEHLKEIFEVKNIVVGKAITVDENGNNQRIWGKNIILAFVPTLESRTEYDPAFAYTVRLKNALNIDEYFKEGNKVKYIRATDIYTPFLVGAEAGYLISNAIA